MRSALVAALLVLSLAGCGGDGEGSAETSGDEQAVADRSLPKDEYVTRADDICRDVVRKVLEIQEELSKTETPQEAADLLQRQLDAIRDMRRRLAALGAPEGNRAVAEELIADIKDAEPHLEAVIASLRKGDEAEAQQRAQRYAEASMESARQVRESGLDFEVCGSGA